jgi:fructokinase
MTTIMAYRVGIDMGGTKIEGAVLDPDGNVLVRKRIPTNQDQGYDAILNRVADLYVDIIHEVNCPEHTLGVGTPGALIPRTGRLKNSNTLCLKGKPIQRDLEQRVNHALRLENDANCFALAEAKLGAGKGNRMVFGVIMGTGCGGGLTIDGEVWTGPQAIAGEWGHMSIQPDGPVCYCGQRGCVETFISGGGLENMWRHQYGSNRALPDIVIGYRNGDPDAVTFMAEFFNHFGRALANVINILDPDVIVLGGGVSNIDEIYTEGIDAVRRHVFTDNLETPIVRHQLGDSAGVIGAALIGIR